MLYTSLNFGIYVTDFDPASYRLESTLVLFRNSTPVPLFLFCVRTAQQSQTRSLSLAVLGSGLRVARLAVLRPNFGNLAVFQAGWPYDFGFGRF